MKGKDVKKEYYKETREYKITNEELRYNRSVLQWATKLLIKSGLKNS